MEGGPHLPPPSEEMANFERNVQIDEAMVDSSIWSQTPGAPLAGSVPAESGSPSRSPTRPRALFSGHSAAFKRQLPATSIIDIPELTSKRPTLSSTPRMPRILSTTRSEDRGASPEAGEADPENEPANATNNQLDLGDETGDVLVYEDPATGDQARKPPYQFLSPIMEASVETTPGTERKREQERERERGRAWRRSISREHSREPPREPSRERSREPTLGAWGGAVSGSQRHRSSSREPTRQIVKYTGSGEGYPEQGPQHGPQYGPQYGAAGPGASGPDSGAPYIPASRELSGPIPRSRQNSGPISHVPSTPQRVPSTPQRRAHTPFHPATPGRVVIPSSPQRDRSMLLGPNEIDTVDALMGQLNVPLDVYPVSNVLPQQMELGNLNPVQHSWAELVQTEIAVLCEKGVALEADLKAAINSLNVRDTARKYMSGDRAQRREHAKKVGALSEYLKLVAETLRVEREMELQSRGLESAKKINAEYKARLDDFEELGAQLEAIYTEMERLRDVQNQSAALQLEVDKLSGQVDEVALAIGKKQTYLSELVQRNTLAERRWLECVKVEDQTDAAPPEAPPATTSATPANAGVGATRQQYLAKLEAMRIELGVDDIQQLADGLVLTVKGLRIRLAAGLALQFELVGIATPLSSHFLYFLSTKRLRLKAAIAVWKKRHDLGLAINEFMRRGGCTWRSSRRSGSSVLELEKRGDTVLCITNDTVQVMPGYSQLALLASD